MKPSTFTEEQMVRIMREADAHGVAETAKKHGINEQMIYVWRKRIPRHGGRGRQADEAARGRERQAEEAVGEQVLAIDVLKEINAKNGERARTELAGPFRPTSRDEAEFLRAQWPRRVHGAPRWALAERSAHPPRHDYRSCHAHLRRYFHDALKTAPIAQEAIDFIRELYAAEHDARDRGMLGTNSHLEFRRQRAGPIRARLKEWLERQKGIQLPKSPIGTAIRYALNNWEELGRFLDDARIPLDNNASEAALRRVALGRKNFLFVGDVDAGTNIAGLYTLIATCEARGINPFAYLADVITRVGDAADDPDRIANLLPGAWLRARTAASIGEPPASLPQQAATPDA